MRISARFARVESEVQNSEAEDFLEEDFFGGEVEYIHQHLPHPPSMATVYVLEVCES